MKTDFSRINEEYLREKEVYAEIEREWIIKSTAMKQEVVNKILELVNSCQKGELDDLDIWVDLDWTDSGTQFTEGGAIEVTKLSSDGLTGRMLSHHEDGSAYPILFRDEFEINFDYMSLNLYGLYEILSDLNLHLEFPPQKIYAAI